MKHYTSTKKVDGGVFELRSTERISHRAECNAKANKRSYRHIERRALDRMVESDVVAELSGYTEQERAYWWGEFQRTRCDFENLECAEVYLRESGQWTESHTAIFAAAYREIRERSEKAYREWFAVAA